MDSGNLVSAQAKILTAVIDKTQSDYPDLAKRLEEMMPMKGHINGALFTRQGDEDVYGVTERNRLS